MQYHIHVQCCPLICIQYMVQCKCIQMQELIVQCYMYIHVTFNAEYAHMISLHTIFNMHCIYMLQRKCKPYTDAGTDSIMYM